MLKKVQHFSNTCFQITSMEKPFKIKNCSQKFLLPISFLSRTFLLPSILFFPRMTFYSQKSSKKFCWQKFLPKRICSSKACPPPPQNKILPRKCLSKRICSQFCSQNFYPKEFAPQVFPSKNLLPNIFALHISSHKKLLPKFCSPKIFAAQTTLYSSYGT